MNDSELRKFVRVAKWRAKAHQHLASESDQALLDLSAAARRCVDDATAMRVIRCVHGVGLALGSALLMVMDPDHWTVMDRHALVSVRAVGYTDVPSSSLRDATWAPYLGACRAIGRRTRLPLRTVDRALWAADGAETLPAQSGAITMPQGAAS